MHVWLEDLVAKFLEEVARKCEPETLDLLVHQQRKRRPDSLVLTKEVHPPVEAFDREDSRQEPGSRPSEMWLSNAGTRL